MRTVPSVITVKTSSSARTIAAALPSTSAVERPVRGGRPRRAPHRPRLRTYGRLAVAVLAVNAIVLLVHLGRGDWRLADGTALAGTSDAALVNTALAVLIRQQLVITGLFNLAGSGSRSWPLRLRWALSKVFHVGGVHVGASVAATAWFVAMTVVLTRARSVGAPAASPGIVTTTWCLCALLVAIVVLALPPVRRRSHDVFELSHRLGGWSVLVLVWVLVVVSRLDHRGPTSPLLALVTSWQVLLLATTTASVALPWLYLRKVPVDVERLSSHAAVATFTHRTPPLGANLAISRSPLHQWHSFATIRRPGEAGFRLLVSRAGDWTGAFIDDPPRHVWVRGLPVASLARLEPLYERIVYVVTGSGLGPSFGQLLASPVPIRLVWSVRSPRATYGDALVDEVEAAQPDAVVWDTTARGKPDLFALTEQACRDTGAEAVFVVSNERTTTDLVARLERAGRPAFGPVFDS